MRILLDQKDWIGLARADQDGSDSTPYTRLLPLLRELKRAGHSFPLSQARYLENGKIRSVKHRRDIAIVMAELSGFEALLGFDACIHLEFGRMVNRRFGTSLGFDRSLFGFGVNQAFGRIGFVLEGIEGLSSTVQESLQAMLPVLLEEQSAPFEFQALAYENDDAPLGDPAPLAKVATAFEDTFVAEERRFADLLRGHAGDNRVELDRVARAQTLVFFIDHLVTALTVAAIPLEVIDELTDRDVSVVDDLPIIQVIAALRAQQVRDANRPVTANDYYDVVSLAQGVPYCDLVSADRAWADLVNRTGLPERYGTTVTGRPNQLLDRVADLADEA